MGLTVYFSAENSVFSGRRDPVKRPRLRILLFPNPAIQLVIIPRLSQSSRVFRFKQPPVAFFEFQQTEKDSFQVRPLRLLARLLIERDGLLLGFDAQDDGPQIIQIPF